MVVVSEDGGLVNTLESIADSIKNCQIQWIRGLPNSAGIVLDDQAALVIVHAPSSVDYAHLVHCLQWLSAEHRHIPRLVIFDEHDAERALACLKRGVTDCLARPLDLRRIRLLIESLTLRARFTAKSAQPDVREDALSVVYKASSHAMRRVLQHARRVAAKQVPVLLTGETGVGKTFLAKLMHQISPRADRPFVAVNCGALPTTLVESELFGHKKGSFTDAERDRVGRFAAAKDGTLFLDEVDALSFAAQIKLLRALDERVFEPVGSNESIALKARIITATNQSLAAAVEAGEFRGDLYYRLNVVEITVPPLRERRSEIRYLTNGCLQEFSMKHGIVVPSISTTAWMLLEAHDWPGNVRELRNAIERAMTLVDGAQIDGDDLPLSIRNRVMELQSDDSGVPLGTAHGKTSRPKRSLADARQHGELSRLAEVLLQCNNNRAQAARELGISRTALYKKLVAYGMQ